MGQEQWSIDRRNPEREVWLYRFASGAIILAVDFMLTDTLEKRWFLRFNNLFYNKDGTFDRYGNQNRMLLFNILEEAKELGEARIGYFSRWLANLNGDKVFESECCGSRVVGLPTKETIEFDEKVCSRCGLILSPDGAQYTGPRLHK